MLSASAPVRTTAAFISVAVSASIGLAPAGQLPIEPTPMELSADEVRAAMLDSQLSRPAPRAEEAPLRDPLGRSRGALDLSTINPSLRIEYGSAADRISERTLAEHDLGASDASTLYDAVLRLEALRLGDFTLVMRSGLRGAQVDDSADSVIDSLRWGPVAGAGLEWSPGGKFFASGGALFSMDEGNGSLHEITAELGMRVTPDMSFSLGYRTLDSAFAAPTDAADELRNAAFAAIRLRF